MDSSNSLNKQVLCTECTSKLSCATKNWCERVNKTLIAIPAKEEDTREYTGGSVNYYRIPVDFPTTQEQDRYIAECNDIIEALELNYAEGNVLKALWRLAAHRKGKSKRGYKNGIYDAEKMVFFSERVLLQQREL